MALTETVYCTESEADSIIGEVATWEDLESESKITAIEYAAIYMDTHYSIPKQTGTISQGLINANALLASEQAVSSLFNRANLAQPEKGLTKTKVKADVVESEKTFDPNVSNVWRDPFPEVTAMLRVYGFPLSKGSGGISQSVMIRR